MKRSRLTINIAAIAISLVIYNRLHGLSLTDIESTIVFSIAVMFLIIAKDFLLTIFTSYQILGLKTLMCCFVGILIIFYIMGGIGRGTFPYISTAYTILLHQKIFIQAILRACAAGALLALTSILFRIILFIHSYRPKK